MFFCVCVFLTQASLFPQRINNTQTDRQTEPDKTRKHLQKNKQKQNILTGKSSCDQTHSQTGHGLNET